MAKSIMLKIKTTNSAFDENPEFEVAEILRHAAEKIGFDGISEFSLWDSNGNVVGEIKVAY